MILREIRRAIGEMQRLTRGPDGQAQWFKYGSLTVPCVPTSIAETTIFDAEGNEVQLALALICSTEHWEAMGIEQWDAAEAGGTSVPDEDSANATRFPRDGELIEFRARQYRVARYAFDSTLAQVRLDLADPASNQ